MKIGRNDLCPCGSGKKYKKCCLYKQQNTVVENDYEDIDFNKAEFLINVRNNFRSYFLEKRPHIKEYEKTRKLHSEIINNMVHYFESGKFEQKVDTDYVPHTKSVYKREDSKSENTVILIESSFDLETREGVQGLYDMLIYKKAPNINCITEEFIQKHRYRKPEKIEFLQSMLNSEVGLFEITGTDSEEGYACLKEVFTGSEYRITDIGLSGDRGYDRVYIYTRIITYHNVSFSTGLSLIFSKTDPFINSFIKQQKKDYNPLGEFTRFVELHNHYSGDSKRIKAVTNSF